MYSEILWRKLSGSLNTTGIAILESSCKSMREHKRLTEQIMRRNAQRRRQTLKRYLKSSFRIFYATIQKNTPTFNSRSDIHRCFIFIQAILVLSGGCKNNFQADFRRLSREKSKVFSNDRSGSAGMRAEACKYSIIDQKIIKYTA